jgi:hypothetical protein
MNPLQVPRHQRGAGAGLRQRDRPTNSRTAAVSLPPHRPQHQTNPALDLDLDLDLSPVVAIHSPTHSSAQLAPRKGLLPSADVQVPST